jgi:hypothetical protein
MCNVDTGVLGQVWYDKKDPNAFPDFNTKHTCKNYEDIRKWAKSLQVSIIPQAGSEPTDIDLWTQAPPADTLPDNFLASPDSHHVLEFTP